MLDISLEDDIAVTDPVKKFLQEIDVVMNTSLTHVLGEPGFGSEFEQFLWVLYDASDNITEYTRDLIRDNCPSQSSYVWDVGCQRVFDDDGEEYYYLLIIIATREKELGRKAFVIHNYANPSGKQVIESETKL